MPSAAKAGGSRRILREPVACSWPAVSALLTVSSSLGAYTELTVAVFKNLSSKVETPTASLLLFLVMCLKNDSNKMKNNLAGDAYLSLPKGLLVGIWYHCVFWRQK